MKDVVKLPECQYGWLVYSLSGAVSGCQKFFLTAGQLKTVHQIYCGAI
jgi:hypothetical protein